IFWTSGGRPDTRVGNMPPVEFARKSKVEKQAACALNETQDPPSNRRRRGSRVSGYGTAHPGEIDRLELAYLSGAEGPPVESRSGWDVDGVKIRVILDFGAGFIDHRSWFMNSGSRAWPTSPSSPAGGAPRWARATSASGLWTRPASRATTR